ncbi:MAG: hypothetical protein KDD62_05830, partial [Bdellovibrionales bacterium]|nr:hypothetical protein [Bdellovibrionales bacterium]
MYRAKIVPLITFLLLTCFSSQLFAQTNTISILADPFGGVADTDGVHTVATANYGNVTFKVTDDGVGTAFGSLTTIGNGVDEGFIYGPHSGFFSGLAIMTSAGSGLTGIWFCFATDNGGEFSFDQFEIGEGLGLFTRVEVIGFRDGTQVASEFVTIISSSNLLVKTIASANFNNVDEVRIRQATPGLYDSGTPGFEAIGIDGIAISPALPAITSATYNASTGNLVVTGTKFETKTGAANDVSVSKLSITGSGGASYTLTSSDVEIDSSTQFTVLLNTTDKLNINGLLDKNGTISDDSTTYNLAAADDFIANFTSGDSADIFSNGITVSNVAVPTVTSASYVYNTGVVTITGTNFVKKSGASDYDTTKFSFTGLDSSSYTLASTTNGELTSETSLSFTLSASDKLQVNSLLNRNGTSASDLTTYNIAAADNWLPAAAPSSDIADTSGNTITVSNFVSPTISSATYDPSTKVLAVTGTNLVTFSGATNDVDASLFTLTGEAGGAYTLTDTPDVEVASETSFSLTLSATDALVVNGLLNKNGTQSDSATTYNLAAADDWLAGTDVSLDISDLVSNGITVSNVSVPTITSATYNVSTGALVVTGTAFVNKIGAANDVNVSTITITGEGGATRTLSASNNVDVTSATSFTVTLATADKDAVDQILNKNGTSSSDATTYNLAAADNWLTGAAATLNIADTSGNGITVSNVPVPTITSATYNASTGVLAVTGTGLVHASGANNDVDCSKFTITGEGSVTYTLTDTLDVEVSSGTSFSVTLSATDKLFVNGLLNKDGPLSDLDSAVYNLAAA